MAKFMKAIVMQHSLGSRKIMEKYLSVMSSRNSLGFEAHVNYFSLARNVDRSFKSILLEFLDRHICFVLIIFNPIRSDKTLLVSSTKFNDCTRLKNVSENLCVCSTYSNADKDGKSRSA